MRQDNHRRDVLHAVRRNVALLLAIEPVEGESTPRLVVGSSSGLIAGPRRYGGPVLQPVAQRRWGELALVPVGYRGEKGDGAAEEPCHVYLWWLLHCRIHTDVRVRYLVRWRGNHVYGRGRGETSASQDRGVEVVYAIPTMASFLICPEGPYRRLGVWHQPKYSRLLCQPADVQ